MFQNKGSHISTTSKNNKYAKEKSSRNITQMVFLISCLYFIGNAPLLIVNNILISYFFTQITPVLNILNIISFAVLFLSHGLNIFIFYFFNKLFRNVLTSYINKLILFQK